ncbi:MAG: Nif3-like dinuclear metal center hexameric protein, partial [Chlorobi bacterium]|nr:Nif3-like dinuclear metal center hexameric protein [Chlorobiota bacterium]
MIKVQEVLNILNEWAPPAVAWERDNVGLLVGNPGAEITGILVAPDVTREVVYEARERGANLIVAHHPV